MTVKKLLQLVLSVILACFFSWCIVRQIKLVELKQAFDNTVLIWIVTALFAFAVGYSCRIERWRLMLKRDNPSLKWINCAGPFLASFAANNILPFRAGDVLRAFAFNRKLGTSSGVVIATLFVERLLDLLMVIVLLAAALAFFGMETTRFAGVGSVVFIAGAVTILIILLFPHTFAPLAVGFGRLVARIAPNFGIKLIDEINKSLAMLLSLAKNKTMLTLIVWSLMAWLAEGCVFWLVALALPSLTTPVAGWLALPVGTLATLIPSTPGYIGTFDYATVRAMTELGNTAAAATAYALLVHALLWLPLTLIGGLYLLTHSTQRHDKLKVIEQ